MIDFAVDIADRQTHLAVDHDWLRAAVGRVLLAERIGSAEISLALVDDAEIRGINREFLGHDHATDVISFVLNEEQSEVRGQTSEVRSQESGVERPPTHAPDSHPSSLIPHPSPLPQPHLHGELIISTETAVRAATAHGWNPADELLLYVVHGLLHLCGYDDRTDEVRPVMRARERELLAGWHLVPTGLEA